MIMNLLAAWLAHQYNVRPPALNATELNQLAAYNSERARGIVHTWRWQHQMKLLQDRYNETSIHHG
jgi:hypothetical protein